jgi:hypothetical protein
MRKHPILFLFILLLAVSLACSASDLGNVSDVGITQCTQTNGRNTITCQSARADISGKSRAKFNFSTGWNPADASVAHVQLTLTVAGQGQAQASFKIAGSQTATVQASSSETGSVSADVPLTLEHVRSAAEATRTGMSMDNKYFIVDIQPLGGAKAEGVQINVEVTLAK